MELYPLKFHPQIKDKIWGGSKLKEVLNKKEAGNKAGESWEISGYIGSISEVSEGFLAGNNLLELIEIYMGDLVGDKVFNDFGLEFPLLIKFIHAEDVLSIQVHPDDNIAMKRHQAFGKTEMWYILESDPGAELIIGFNREMDKESYVDFLESDNLPEVMNHVNIDKGDVFYIPAGRVHAIGAGVLLAEIQQTSDLTYRIYDWNRKDDNGNARPLHTEEALDVIDFTYHNNYHSLYNKKLNKVIPVVDSEYFTTNIMIFDKPVEKDFILIDSFILYICTEGKAVVKYDKSPGVTIEKGETLLVPAILKIIEIIPEGQCTLLEVYIK
jgi:mannose-6-phosphate isomerase